MREILWRDFDFKQLNVIYFATNQAVTILVVTFRPRYNIDCIKVY